MANESAGPAGSQGMSTGKKLAIGCGVLVALGVLAVVALVGVGGFMLKDRAEDFVGGMEEQGQAQEEASRILERLQEEHPFEVPEDGVVEERQARRFFATTDAAWEELEQWAEELETLDQRMEDRESPGVSDLMAGMRSMGQLARSRLVLAEALEEQDMAPSEYLWTGLALTRAYRSLEAGGTDSGVPEENLELAREYRDELAALSDDDDEATDKGAVLALAMFWGMGDLETWEVMGFDTLR